MERTSTSLVQEQTLAIRARELVPRAEVEEAWSAEVAAVRAKLLAWPGTVSDQVRRAAELKGVAGVEKAITAAVEELLFELSAPRTSTSSSRKASTKKEAASSSRRKTATRKKPATKKASSPGKGKRK